MRRYMGLIALLLVTGCGTGAKIGATAGGVGDGNPTGRDSSMKAPALDSKRRGTMTVTPAMAAPGQGVALRFPSKQERGIAFSLAARGEKGWTVAYYLTSDWGSPGSHAPDWWSVAERAWSTRAGIPARPAWLDVGILGPGPDHVIVPDNAPAGEYLLCTANSADEACATLTVTG